MACCAARRYEKGMSFTINRRTLFGAAAGYLGARSLAFATGAGTGVVELFTSQGCSSCPPADAFADELARDPRLTVLTYHVDYWDYLGWKDTLGAAPFSQRQYDYAKARGDMDVYTPQIIVNGGRHFTGTDKAAVKSALAQSANGGPAMTITTAQDMFNLQIGSAEAAGEDAMVWLLPLVDAIDVEISKGENAGKTITYYNVVRDVVPAGRWTGAASMISLPLEPLMPKTCTGCVALLQSGKAGPVLSSTRWGKLAHV